MTGLGTLAVAGIILIPVLLLEIVVLTLLGVPAVITFVVGFITTIVVFIIARIILK